MFCLPKLVEPKDEITASTRGLWHGRSVWMRWNSSSVGNWYWYKSHQRGSGSGKKWNTPLLLLPESLTECLYILLIGQTTTSLCCPRFYKMVADINSRHTHTVYHPLPHLPARFIWQTLWLLLNFHSHNSPLKQHSETKWSDPERNTFDFWMMLCQTNEVLYDDWEKEIIRSHPVIYCCRDISQMSDNVIWGITE